MRDRLIELLLNSDPLHERDLDDDLVDGEIEAIADHLLKSGVIVPPCKVGDAVFVLSQGAGFSVVWNVYKSIVKAVHLDERGQLFVRVETDRENVGGYVEIERVYLTREEAEKALAEREGK